MSQSAASPEPSTDLLHLLREEEKQVRLPDGQLRRGAALLFVAGAARRGVDLGARFVASTSALLGLDQILVQRTVTFYLRLAGSRGADAPIMLCRGVSCMIRGASDLHQRLRTQVTEGGTGHVFGEVFCLNYCDRGPSIMVDRAVYCCGTHDMDEDRRTWRGPDVGPVSVTDSSAPVRD